MSSNAESEHGCEEPITVTLSVHGYRHTIPERYCIGALQLAIITAAYSVVFTYSMLTAAYGLPALVVGTVVLFTFPVALQAANLADDHVLVCFYLLPAAAAILTAFHGWRPAVALLAADYAFYFHSSPEPEFASDEKEEQPS